MPIILPEQNSFVDTALELLSRAIRAEDDHEYPKAYAHYMAAIDYLMAAQQAETNEKSRALLKTKLDEYLDRAETIRQRRVRSPVDTPERPNGQGVKVTSGVVSSSNDRTTPQSVILDEAFMCARLAIDADVCQNYEEAYKQYMKCMDYFMFAQRYELDDQSRYLIRSEVAEYLSRAESIKRQKLEPFQESQSRKKLNLSNTPPRLPEAIFLHTAVEITQRAIQEDTQKNYRLAYDLYNSALDYFMLAQKYEKNEQSKAAIRTNVEEYLTRAEALKKCI